MINTEVKTDTQQTHKAQKLHTQKHTRSEASKREKREQTKPMKRVPIIKKKNKSPVPMRRQKMKTARCSSATSKLTPVPTRKVCGLFLNLVLFLFSSVESASCEVTVCIYRQIGIYKESESFSCAKRSQSCSQVKKSDK
jgi:hypothetical protein